MNGKQGMIWKEAVVACLKVPVLSQHNPRAVVLNLGLLASRWVIWHISGNNDLVSYT
jgi:hypothetical protein